MNASGRKTAFWIRNDKVREQKRGIGIGIGIGITHRREERKGGLYVSVNHCILSRSHFPGGG